MTIKMISIQMVLRIWKHKDLLAGVTTTSAKIKQHHSSQEFPEDILPITFTSRWRLIITCLASEQRSDPWPKRKAIFRQSWKQTLPGPKILSITIFRICTTQIISYCFGGFLLLMMVFRYFFSAKRRPCWCESAQLLVGGTELNFLPLPNYVRDLQVIWALLICFFGGRDVIGKK